MERRATALFSIAGLVLLWWLGSLTLRDPSLLPDPLTVAGLIGHEAASGALPYHLTATLARCRRIRSFDVHRHGHRPVHGP